jgi:hypothetical protein
VQHAGYVVRSLGKELWKQREESQHNRYYLGKHNPPAVRKKYLATIYRQVIHSLYPQPYDARLWITERREGRTRAPPS